MKNSIIFHLSANKELAKKIAKIAKLPLGKVDIRKFADGEIMCRNLSNVRGKDVYIVQSTANPAQDNIFEILIFADSLRNSDAKSVNLVVPYFGYARQDRVALPGEPITAKVVANMYQAAMIDKIITIDLHTQQIQGFFSCPVINLDTFELFGDYFVKYFDENGVKQSDVVVVAPDHGSALRARDLGSMFNGASIAFIDKRRPAPNKSEVINVVGNVNGKTCVIVDDMIDTCGTINNAYDALIDHGAKEVYVCATHAVFSTGKLKSEIKGVVVTDSIERNIKGVKVLSVANILAEAILNN
ncbi:MAG TPA: ribose-phosphate pyrophosphokinase [Firmicutes bacterium]|nr:ribose-phosphate pyrophosphokinase [Bacillota bacterium]